MTERPNDQAGAPVAAPTRVAAETRTGLYLDLLFGLLLPFVCWRVNLWASRELLDVAGPGALALNIGGPFAGLLWLIVLVSAMFVHVVFRPASLVLAGILAACSIWAFLFGVLLVPLSVLTISAVGLGLLCLAPLGSAFVCRRASRRTLATVGSRFGVARRRGTILAAGLATAVSVSWGGHAIGSFENRLVDRIALADEGGRRAIVSRLAFLRPLFGAAGEDPAIRIAGCWYQAMYEPVAGMDGASVTSLGQAYMELTGEPVEDSQTVQRLMSRS